VENADKWRIISHSWCAISWMCHLITVRHLIAIIGWRSTYFTLNFARFFWKKKSAKFSISTTAVLERIWPPEYDLTWIWRIIIMAVIHNIFVLHWYFYNSRVVFRLHYTVSLSFVLLHWIIQIITFESWLMLIVLHWYSVIPICEELRIIPMICEELLRIIPYFQKNVAKISPAST
jgi:hypothetical protein